MSFLKQLLTPFVEFDEEAKKKEEAAAKGNMPVASKPNTQPAPSATQPVAPVVQPAAQQPEANAHHPLIDGEQKNAVNTDEQLPTFAPSGTIAKPMPEHLQYFEKLIDEANRTSPFFKGADYKEFIDSKLDIDDIQDEALKYKTAFNVLKNSGLSKEKLLATGQEYLNIVGRDMNAFQGAQTLQYNKEIRPKEQAIQKKAEELQQLTQRINALKAEINSLTQDINLAKEKFSTARSSFLLAGENKQKEIAAELQKIAKYF